MPVPTMFGVYASGAASGAVIGGASIAGAIGANVLPNVTGMASGDLCLIICPAISNNVTLPAGGAGGWTRLSYAWTFYAGYYWQTYYKILSSGDISAFASNGMSLTVTDNGVAISVLVIRGPTIAAIINNSGEQSTATSPLTNAGFTKAANSKLVLGMCHDRGGQIATTPTGFTSQTTQVTLFAQIIATRPSAAYANGTATSWVIAPVGAGQARISFLLELT